MKATDKPVKPANYREGLGLFRKYLAPYWKELALLLVGFFFFSVLSAVQPLMMAPILEIVVEKVQSNGTEALPPLENIFQIDLNNLGQYLYQWLQSLNYTTWQIAWVLALSYLFVSLAMYLVDFLVYVLGIYIQVRSGRDIQNDLFQHIWSLSMAFFNRRRTGELISRLDQDARSTVFNLVAIAKSLVVSSVLVIIYGTLLIRTNTRLTVFVIAAGGLHYLLTQIIKNPIKQRVRDQFNIFAEISSYLQEAISNSRVVKSFVAEKYEQSQLKDLVARAVKINIRFAVFKNVEQPIGQIVNSLVNVAILLLATHELLNSGLSTTGFFLYLYVGRTVLGPITDLARTYTVFQTTLATSERVNELFAERSDVVGGSVVKSIFESNLRFNGVSFNYGHEPVLQGINLEIQRNQMVALVGPSGSGKSTIVDLILRFYDPSQGDITIDGENLRDLETATYRRLFGVVSQDSQLFNNTVAHNIAYPGLDVSQEELENAAKVANAHEFIMQLPKQYETEIGDRGVLLSGGQRQRLSIARAVIRKPQILLLDEATSSLDSESERMVQEAIDRVIQNTTAVVIAHRLSTVRNADKIIVVEDGRVVDQGRHQELFKRCHLYKRLCELQFSSGG